MNTKRERPVFLTVICIISFAGLGYGIFQALTGMVMLPMFESLGIDFEILFQEALDDIAYEDPELLPFMEKMFEMLIDIFDHMFEIYAVSLICSLLALWGVILMWRLKKIGFYMYTAGKVISVVFPLILMGSNFVTLLILLFGGFFAGVFILLYGLNLKAMK